MVPSAVQSLESVCLCAKAPFQEPQVVDRMVLRLLGLRTACRHFEDSLRMPDYRTVVCNTVGLREVVVGSADLSQYRQ